jgi:beta-lactamase class A
MKRLQDTIRAVIDGAGIEAGVSAWHVESGERVDVNGSKPFPTASVFKIPVLATAGVQLAQGRIRLDRRVAVNDVDKRFGSGILPYFDAGVSPTVHDLLTLMTIVSDNTATDMVLELLGGPAAVERHMHELGLSSISVKLNCKALLDSLFPPSVRELPLAGIRAWTTKHDYLRDGAAFSFGPDNNVSSADDMTRLVCMLHDGSIVGGELKDTLMRMLLRQQFNERLPRFLPPGTPVAHKTGTVAGFRNDSGMIQVGERSHVAVTVFASWDDKAVRHRPEAELQRMFEVDTAIGRIGRLIFDHCVDHYAR